MRKLFASILMATTGVAIAAIGQNPVVLGLGVLAKRTANFREVLWKTNYLEIVLHQDHAGVHGTVKYMSAKHLERYLNQLRMVEEKRKT